MGVVIREGVWKEVRMYGSSDQRGSMEGRMYGSSDQRGSIEGREEVWE